MNMEQSIRLMNDSHPRKAGCFSNLGISQAARFRHLGYISDLENSISNLRKAVELTEDRHPSKPIYLTNLGRSQGLYFEVVTLSHTLLGSPQGVPIKSWEPPRSPQGVHINQS
jgi:hypothetical protein